MGEFWVLAFAMTAKVDFTLEGFITETARERLIARVFSHVCDEIGRLRERFTTNNTLVWLLTCVYVGVFLHVGLLVESFAAILTRVRPCVRVNQKMCGQC